MLSRDSHFPWFPYRGNGFSFGWAAPFDYPQTNFEILHVSVYSMAEVQAKQITKNAVLALEVEDLAFGGMGVARVDNFVVFVERGLPGDHVLARITRKKTSHAQARIESIERPSPHRISDPPCALFGLCGGCTWQNFPYEQQLIYKQRQVSDTIRRLGHQDGFEELPIIPSPEQWHYRNKMEYSFGTGRDGRPILGFHIPGRFDQIFEVPRCHIHPKPYDAMLGILTEYVREKGLVSYDPRSHRGFLRYAVMRHSHTTGESILVLITNRGKLPDADELDRRLREGVPGLKGWLWGIHDGVADVARIGEVAGSWGKPELIETVNDLTFTVSPQSFFQTNTAGAQVLYSRAADFAQIGPNDRVLDAYCGGGAIGLHCAQRGARQVIGVESVKEAIWDARNNAARNGIPNTTFIAVPMPEGLKLATHAAGGSFTRVIIDPPRGGMDKKSLARLIALRAPVFIYVSCNPATLARDLQTICDGGYRVEVVQSVDMFPHTFHVETLVRLRLEV